MPDIYFASEYGKLYEKIENGTCEIFNLSCCYGEVSYMFMKRKIPYLVDNTEYFDIVTPYGYGGPVIWESTDKEKLLDFYNEQISNYCTDHNIVSEFVRFHPLLNNQLDFQKIFEVLYNRQTVSVNLTADDIFMTELSSKCRNTVRKAEKNGVKTSIDYTGSTIETFFELYVDTMRKNEAVDYYYFPSEYFQLLVRLLKNKFIIINSHFNDKIIASAIFLYSDQFMHYHLAATNQKYYSLAPGNAVLWEAISWGKENKLQKLHLGGGLSTSEDDSLYKFKKGFSTSINCNFYVGKRIHNPEVYNKLIHLRKQQDNYDDKTSFFPAYRG